MLILSARDLVLSFMCQVFSILLIFHCHLELNSTGLRGRKWWWHGSFHRVIHTCITFAVTKTSVTHITIVNVQYHRYKLFGSVLFTIDVVTRLYRVKDHQNKTLTCVSPGQLWQRKTSWYVFYSPIQLSPVYNNDLSLCKMYLIEYIAKSFYKSQWYGELFEILYISRQ